LGIEELFSTTTELLVGILINKASKSSVVFISYSIFSNDLKSSIGSCSSSKLLFWKESFLKLDFVESLITLMAPQILDYF
jgi:hypothetical protein